MHLICWNLYQQTLHLDHVSFQVDNTGKVTVCMKPQEKPHEGGQVHEAGQTLTL